MLYDSTEGFYNRETGEIAWLYEFMDSIEREKTVEMVDGWDFIRLPDKYDIHEYSIMEALYILFRRTEYRVNLQGQFMAKVLSCDLRTA